MSISIQANLVVKCEQMACPLPMVKSKQAMETLKPGEVLEVRATDKGSVNDLQSWAKRTGHQYVGLIEENGVYRHFMRKVSEHETKAESNYVHTISNEKLIEKLNSGHPVHVIDVREPAEYSFRRIPGAISIPIGELEQRMDQLQSDRHYFVICRTGNRSDQACQLLAERGFSNVYNVIPGMSEWDGPVEQDVE